MIQLYYMDISGDCSKEQSLAIYESLPIERRQRIDRLKNEQLKRKRLLCGYMMQNILSDGTGIPMHRLSYRYNEQGKPEIDYASIELENVSYNIEETQMLHFNLSHSGDLAVLAVSRYPVGVDVERKTRGYEAVARRCFPEEEYEYVMAGATEAERRRKFLETWTMKEAYVKYRGEGMRIPFASFLNSELPCVKRTMPLVTDAFSVEQTMPFETGAFSGEHTLSDERTADTYMVSVYGEEAIDTVFHAFTL